MLFFFSTSGLQHFLAMNLIIWTRTIPGESILNSYWISLALPISSFIRRILFSSLFPIAHHNIHLYYNIHLYCLSNIDFYQQCSVVLFPQMHISTVHLSSYKDHAIIETKKKKKKLFSFSIEKRKAAEESVFFRRHLSLLLLCTWHTQKQRTQPDSNNWWNSEKKWHN